MGRQALVVRGGWPGHTPVEQSEQFIPYLREQGFEVLVEDSLEVYADADVMGSLDLIVQCWTMGEILPEELRGLRTAVEAGTGLAGWHGGILDSFRLSSDYLQMIGGQFAAHPHDLVPHAVEINAGAGAEHPVTAGIGSYEITSEQYWVLTDSASTVLATTTLPVRDGDPWHEPVVSPAIWTRSWGKGRIFVTTSGHTVEDLQHPAVRTTIERGLLWASRA